MGENELYLFKKRHVVALLLVLMQQICGCETGQSSANNGDTTSIAICWLRPRLIPMLHLQIHVSCLIIQLCLPIQQPRQDPRGRLFRKVGR